MEGGISVFFRISGQAENQLDLNILPQIRFKNQIIVLEAGSGGERLDDGVGRQMDPQEQRHRQGARLFSYFQTIADQA